MSAPCHHTRRHRSAASVGRQTEAACGTAHTEPIGRVGALLQVLAGIALLGASACAPRAGPPAAPTPPPPSPAGALLVRLPAEAGGKVARIPLEAYVAGALAGEQAVGALPAAIAARVLELQAVISRTYALAGRGRHAREGFDLCSDTHCQVFRPGVLAGDRRGLVDAAVASTAGLVVAHRGQPIQALFHSDCGGHTSAAADVWGGTDLPYLVARPDPVCATRPGSAWTLRVTAEELGRALAAEGATQALGRPRGVEVRQVDSGGRASGIALEGRTALVVRGDDFRRAVTAALGPRSLRSLKFTVERVSNGFLFRGRGFGHGAGLCQAGALARLQAGATVRDVLAYYYPGTMVISLGDGRK